MKFLGPRRLAVVLAAVTVAAGCGTGTSTRQTSQVVGVEMTSFAFAPSKIHVRSGGSIRFRFHNPTDVVHEAFLGDQAAQDSHDAEMARAGGMHNMGGAHANEVEVAPGATKEVSYDFQKPGTLILGCHEPGHYSAGMKATITVS